MSDMLAKVEAMRAKSAQKAEVTRTITREALEIGGLDPFADAMREMFDAKLTHLKVGDFEIGKPMERGCSDFVLLDHERRLREEKIASLSNGKAGSRPIAKVR